MRRRRNRFARIGMLSIALLLALCVTGVGYAAWTDTVSIGGTVETGYIGVVLSEGDCSQNVTASIAGHTIDIKIDAGGAGEYECHFDIHNMGTIPVKIQGIVKDCSGGLVPTVSGVEVGTQIEQDDVDPDTVSGIVTMAVPCAGTYTCEVTFDFVQWNLY